MSRITRYSYHGTPTEVTVVRMITASHFNRIASSENQLLFVKQFLSSQNVVVVLREAVGFVADVLQQLSHG